MERCFISAPQKNIYGRTREGNILSLRDEVIQFLSNLVHFFFVNFHLAKLPEPHKLGLSDRIVHSLGHPVHSFAS